MPGPSERQRRFMGADLARKRAGKRTRTGMTERQLRDYASKMPAGAHLSPTGDIGADSQAEVHRAFPRPIKHAGPDVKPAAALPWRRPETAIDPKYGPGDRVS